MTNNHKHDRRVKHGMRHTRVYNIWMGMVQRTTNPNNPDYPHYGGRGIALHPSWRKFVNFYQDMGDCPSNEHTIDRIDNNGNYEPDNCRWATRRQQNRNKRGNRFVLYEGERMLLSDASRLTGIHIVTIFERLKRGWPEDKALATPPRERVF